MFMKCEPKTFPLELQFSCFRCFCRVVAGSSGVGGGAASTVAVTANAVASGVVGAVVSGNQHRSCGRNEFRIR